MHYKYWTYENNNIIYKYILIIICIKILQFLIISKLFIYKYRYKYFYLFL